MEGAPSFLKYEKSKPNFDLVDSDRFTFSILGSSTNGKGRLLLLYEKKNSSDGKSAGRFIKLSKDSGKSFGEELKISDLIGEDPEFEAHKFYLGRKQGFVDWLSEQ